MQEVTRVLVCIFSEKSVDWTNTFELEISGLTDLYDVFLQEQFWIKNESKVPSRIRERDVVTTKSNRVREGNGGGLWWRKGEEKSSCFVVVEFELIFCHPCFDVICACTEVFVFVFLFLVRLSISLRGADFWSWVSSAKSWWFTEWLAMSERERCGVQDEENGPKHRALRHTILEQNNNKWSSSSEDSLDKVLFTICPRVSIYRTIHSELLCVRC